MQKVPKEWFLLISLVLSVDWISISLGVSDHAAWQLSNANGCIQSNIEFKSYSIQLNSIILKLIRFNYWITNEQQVDLSMNQFHKTIKLAECWLQLEQKQPNQIFQSTHILLLIKLVFCCQNCCFAIVSSRKIWSTPCQKGCHIFLCNWAGPLLLYEDIYHTS